MSIKINKDGKEYPIGVIPAEVVKTVNGTVTFLGNWGGSISVLKKRNKIVTASIRYQTGYATSFTYEKIATLPSGFMPSDVIVASCVKMDTQGTTPTGHGIIVFETNGDVLYYGDAFGFQEYAFVNASWIAP